MEIKSNQIFLIKFSKQVDIEDKSHPIYDDFINCLDPGEDKLVGFTDNDDVFVRLGEYKSMRFADIFKKYGFEFEVTDVTNLVISGEIQKLYPEVEGLSPKLFEDFRMDTTSVNCILDKIIDHGIESLDKIDKTILGK